MSGGIDTESLKGKVIRKKREEFEKLLDRNIAEKFCEKMRRFLKVSKPAHINVEAKQVFGG